MRTAEMNSYKDGFLCLRKKCGVGCGWHDCWRGGGCYFEKIWSPTSSSNVRTNFKFCGFTDESTFLCMDKVRVSLCAQYAANKFQVLY